ncbi:MAG: transcription termination factor NusA [Candidatus Paceibacterota bacterium]
MFDLKTLKSALLQLETERGIPQEKILEAIEDALAAAYKKDYGKRGQVVRASFDLNSGKVEFNQIKTVVDESMVRVEEEVDEEVTEAQEAKNPEATRTDNEEDSPEEKEEETHIRFNPEQHILLEDAKMIKKDAQLEEELVFPLEMRSDYGRIAAQTAKQVIIQRIREAERISVMNEFEKRRGEIVSGTVQRIERGNIYVDLGRVIGVLPRNEQIPGEYFKSGDRIRAYLYTVDETARDITLKLSRSHSQFLFKLFEIEVPEIANGTVEVKTIAREAGSRSKIAVCSNDEHIDPVGSCVGGRGVRIGTIMSELGGEKIDVIEWSSDEALFIERAISPGQVVEVILNKEEHSATLRVHEDQYSLAIGKGGQNARLAAKLTGWKIDIREVESGEGITQTPEEEEKEIPSAEKPEEILKEKESLPESPEDKTTSVEDSSEVREEASGQEKETEIK